MITRWRGKRLQQQEEEERSSRNLLEMTVCVPTIRDSVGITASSAQAHHGTPRCIQWPLVHVWWTPCGVVQKNSVATPISRQPGVVATVKTNK